MSAIIAQVLAVGAALTAFDQVLAAVDWEHRSRADYIREHGAALASHPGYLWAAAVIAGVVAILLLRGANHAWRSLGDKLLIAALVATAAVMLSGLWTGSGPIATALRLILPGVALALLFLGRARPTN
jgi:hypothetical protein